MRTLIAALVVVCAAAQQGLACPTGQFDESVVQSSDAWVPREQWIVVPARPSLYYLPHDRFGFHIEAESNNLPVAFDLVRVGDATRIDLHIDSGFVTLRTTTNDAGGAVGTVVNHYWVAPKDHFAPAMHFGLLEVGDDPAVFTVEGADGSVVTVPDIDLDALASSTVRVTAVHTDHTTAILWERAPRRTRWLALAFLILSGVSLVFIGYRRRVPCAV